MAAVALGFSAAFCAECETVRKGTLWAPRNMLLILTTNIMLLIPLSRLRNKYGESTTQDSSKGQGCRHHMIVEKSAKGLFKGCLLDNGENCGSLSSDDATNRNKDSK